jgi:hypothetical protein
MSEISKQALLVDNSQSFPNNNAGAITPSDLRAFNVNMIDSLVDEITYNVDSASWNQQITALESFTSSQQPSFTALNSFTASQLTINTGVNLFTQSANASINSLSAEIDQLQTWSGSVNEIRFNSGVPQYATRWNFGGFISASFVPNVNGLIADINVLNDPSKLNTSSFNEYTASTAATQSVFSASVATSISQSSNAFNTFSASQNSFNLSATASLVELLNLSSSLSGGYATQGELDQSASVLQANIDTKLNTSSFNAYTQSFSQSVATSFSQSYAYINSYTASTNIRLNNLEATSASLSIETANLELFSASTITRLNGLSSFTASYATTGSNVFTGSQTITGSLIITGSAYGNIVSMSVVSNTASMDLSISNFFTLGLTSGQNTRIEPTNILPGETINLLISQPSIGSGSVSYPSTFKFASGLPYSASLNSASVDIMTFITFNTGSIYAASIKNLR